MDSTLCWTSLRNPLCSTALASLCPISLFIRKGTTAVPCMSIIAEKTDGFAAKERPLQAVARRLILLRHAESSWSNRLLRGCITSNSLALICVALLFWVQTLALFFSVSYSNCHGFLSRRFLIGVECFSCSCFPPLYQCFNFFYHDRCLSDIGRADAANVAHKLQQLGWIPEVILCSDATRTRETLSIMQEQVKAFLDAAVHFCPSFYSVAAMDGQTTEHLQQMICKLSGDEILTVLCMGHNKGWEEAASMLTGSVIELKTCNAALLEATGESWEQAFASAGFGGWKLHAIVKPHDSLDNIVPA